MELFFTILIVELSLIRLFLYKNWFHIIIIILLIELFSVLSFKLVSISTLVFLNRVFLFTLLVIIVVEARLGISLVVGSTRSWGDRGLKF